MCGLHISPTVDIWPLCSLDSSMVWWPSQVWQGNFSKSCDVWFGTPVLWIFVDGWCPASQWYPIGRVEAGSPRIPRKEGWLVAMQLVSISYILLPRGATKKKQCWKTISCWNTKKSGTSAKSQRSIATVRKLQSQNQHYCGTCPKVPVRSRRLFQSL